MDYNSYTGPSEIKDTITSQSSTLVKLSPGIVSSGRKWKLKAGINIQSEIGNTTRFHFYPEASFKYNVVGNLIIPYAGITGNMDRNNLSSLTNENPYMVYSPLKNSNRKYEVYGGIRGLMGSDMS